MWQRFPPRMRKAISNALQEAGRLGVDEAGPEHLLLAVAKDSESAGAFMLEHSGIALAQLVRDVEQASAPGPERIQRAGRVSSALLHVLDVAVGEADRLRHAHVGTEHVALSLTLVNGNLASETIGRLGFT